MLQHDAILCNPLILVSKYKIIISLFQNDLLPFFFTLSISKLCIILFLSVLKIDTRWCSGEQAPVPLTHSRRDLFRVFDIGFGQIEGILGIILAKEFFIKSN